MSEEPRPPDLAEISERWAGRVQDARHRVAAAPRVHRTDDRPDDGERAALSPVVVMVARTLDELIPRRYRCAVPALPQTWEWVTNAPDGAGLLLFGRTGTGKTHEAYGAIRAWAAAGLAPSSVSVVFGNVADLLDRVRPGRDRCIEDLQECALLLLDDLGAFKASEWTEEALYRVIDARWAQMLPTLATSNMTPADLAVSLGDRLTSRLVGVMKQVTMTGTDQRRSHR